MMRSHTYAGPEVLNCAEARRPRPVRGEVLIRVPPAGRHTVELLLAAMPEFELAVVLGTGLVAGGAWDRWGIWPAIAFVALGTGLAVLVEALAMLSPLTRPPRLAWPQIAENVVLHLVIIALMSGFTRMVLVMLAWSRVL